MFIYKITNTKNKKIYIGQTTKSNPNLRWKSHQYKLRAGIHHNSHLQSAWNKYGQDCWTFEVLEEGISCINELADREEYWTEKFQSCNPEIGYNKMVGNNRYTTTDDARERMSKSGGNRKGQKHSEETKERIRQTRLGTTLSEETKKKIGESLTGRKRPPVTEETREKLSKSHMGHSHSEETRKKMSKSRKGVPKSREWVEKMLASRKKTLERKKKLKTELDNNV